MKTNELLKEINQLPTRQRIFLIEKAIQSIRKQDENDQMKKAVDSLYSNYKNDKELTAFTNIDFEDFYEAR
jgi:hypothetical protein